MGISVLLALTMLVLALVLCRCRAQARALSKLPESASIVGIAKGMPVKKCLKANPGYARYEPPTVVSRKASLELQQQPQQPDSISSSTVETSASNRSSYRSSVIGIEAAPVEQSDRDLMHYAHILPRYRPAPEAAYLDVLTPPRAATLGRPHHPWRAAPEAVAAEQYEFVGRPMPQYENEQLQMLGFSSLRRDKAGLGRQPPVDKGEEEGRVVPVLKGVNI